MQINSGLLCPDLVDTSSTVYEIQNTEHHWKWDLTINQADWIPNFQEGGMEEDKLIISRKLSVIL